LEYNFNEQANSTDHFKRELKLREDQIFALKEKLSHVEEASLKQYEQVRLECKQQVVREEEHTKGLAVIVENL